MNQMDRVFDKMTKSGEKILILYFPIGDTILDDSVAWAEKYFRDGCTVLEVGLPYEDPSLDGKTVRESMARARSQVNLDQVFELLARIRERCPDNVIQVMTYHGNCLKYGYPLFAQKCADAGVDGVLCPDASPEQLEQLDRELETRGVHNLRFSPYHLTQAAIEDLKQREYGYIFQQAVDGGTGPRETVSPQIRTNVQTLKDAGVKVPVCAGFGISNASQAAEAIALGADGVIVGSAAISHIQSGDGEEFIASLREAIRKEKQWLFQNYQT